MGDAFKCDECGDYYDGKPAEVVYTRSDTQRREYNQRAELCEDCSENFAGGPE